MPDRATLTVGRRRVAVSNLEKIFYPRAGFTKGDVIDYYVRVSPVLLPHLARRAVSLKRYPDGVEGFFFYEKNAPDHRPPWIKTTPVPRDDGRVIHYCVLGDLPSLVWAANLANLELHAFLHRATPSRRPTTLAFDLDPGPPADILACCRVGLWIRDVFAALGLRSFPKTSGSKGLQVYVPLHPGSTYDHTKAFAHRLAERLEALHPEAVVSRMLKSLRAGKVLVDWSQNDDAKTTVCAYSLRGRERPTVSTPVTWDEVETAWKRRDAALLTFEAAAVLDRVASFGDLFAPVLSLRQKLPPLAALDG